MGKKGEEEGEKGRVGRGRLKEKRKKEREMQRVNWEKEEGVNMSDKD